MDRGCFVIVCLMLVLSFPMISLCQLEDEPEEAEVPVFPEGFVEELNISDIAITGIIKNCVKGTNHDYAVIETHSVLKGPLDLKIAYVAFEPEKDSLYETGRQGLWLLKDIANPRYYVPVEKIQYLEEPQLAENEIKEILAKQNTVSKDDLELSISASKQTYFLDEPVRIDMTITNKGSKAATFEDSCFWRFTHTYGLAIDDGTKVRKFTITKPEGGPRGEISGPKFVRLMPGESAKRSFNLIRLLSVYPPSEGEINAQIPSGKAFLTITWDTSVSKEIFPDRTYAFAIDSNWTSNELEIIITDNKLDNVFDAVEAIERESGVKDVMKAISSGDEKTSEKAIEAFVEYASPALAPEFERMLLGENTAERDAAGRAFIRLAKHPDLTDSGIVKRLFEKSRDILDARAYNEVQSVLASIAIRQNKRDYVEPLVESLASERTTILTKKEIVAAISGITGIEDLSEENFEETVDRVRKWLIEGKTGDE